MTKPTGAQLNEVFTALVNNGFDFFVRSAHELAKEQKFSITHFATGLELLLKARLFHEHWTLIATEPHKCAWTSVKDGTVQTIRASELCAVITTTTGTPLNAQQSAFKSVFDHRNRVLHWAPNDKLGDTVAEQCLAWYYLQLLLTGPWSKTFAPFQKRIEEVETRLRAHQTYLQVRYEKLENKLKGIKKAKRLLKCPACDLQAGVAANDAKRVVTFECLVCTYKASAARFECGALYALDALPIEKCPCSNRHDREKLLDILDPIPLMSPKEMSTYEPDRGYCGECFDIELTVAPNGDDHVCITCGAQFAPNSSTSCKWCNERWFGRDSDFSYYSGCEHCEGRGIDD